MKQELADQQTAIRAAEIRRHASQPEETVLAPSGAGGSPPRGTDVINEMMKRLDGFENMLRSHASSSSPQNAIVAAQPGSPQSPSSPAAPVSPTAATGGTANDSEKKTRTSEAIQRALHKMKAKPQKVSDVFARQLEQYAEVDVELWHAHFPVGYRERLASELVAEIVATDKTLEAWSRDFPRDRELLDCFPARELIATCSAMGFDDPHRHGERALEQGGVRAPRMQSLWAGPSLQARPEPQRLDEAQVCATRMEVQGGVLRGSTTLPSGRQGCPS